MFSNYFDLQRKSAIVTGGNRGLGKAMATALARAGADITLVARDEELLKSVADEISSLGSRVLAAPTDVTNASDIDAMITRCLQELGKIDILVNNAGAVIHRPVVEMTEDEWDNILRVNLKGQFLCARAVGKTMIGKGGGKIINIASFLGIVGATNTAANCASKGGVIQLTKALALEWAKHNIQVNAIAPGFFDTDSMEDLRKNKKLYGAIVQKIPMKRIGRPEELSGLVVLLASDASSYITGQTFVIDGGFTVK